MNLLIGLHHTIYHPRLIIIPLMIHLTLTITQVVGVFLGFSLFSFHRFDFYIPYWMLPLDNLSLLSNMPTTSNWPLTFVATVLIILIKSYALSMYLGSIKCFLEGPDNTYSILKIAPYYFKRMVVFSIMQFIYSSILIFLANLYWPLAVLTILIVIFFSLTPFLIVLEDTTVLDALANSPKQIIKNFRIIFIIILIAVLLTFLIIQVPFNDKFTAYYFTSLISSFIGTTLIFAIMNSLHLSIYQFSLPPKRVRKSRMFFPPLWIVALLLPFLGALLANV
ncbi:hypothetical protein [Bacillus nitroreducens]